MSRPGPLGANLPPRPDLASPAPPIPGPIRLVLGLVFLVGFPAFVTTLAPVSRVALDSDGTTVSATVQTLVFLTFPSRTTRLTELTRVGATAEQGTDTRDRDHPGRHRSIRSEGTAALVLAGPDREIRVPVSPVDIDRVEDACRAFLDHPDRAGLRLRVVANWKIGVFVGIPLSLLTLAYAVYLSCSLAFRIFLAYRSFIRSRT